MKQVALVFLLLVFNFYVSTASAGNPMQMFIVRGNIDGLKNGVSLYLVQYSTGDTISKEISKKGKFVFKGVVPKGTEYYFIRIDTSLSKQRSTEFLLVNEKLTLTANFAHWPKVILNGSDPNDEFHQLIQLWSSTEGKHNQKDSVKSFINRYQSSLYIADLIRRLDKKFSLDERQQMYNHLTQKAKDSYFGELLRSDLILARKRETIKEGTVMPDFVVTLPDNSKVTAMELVSKAEYTLIDFWASWCKPCREAVPGMKKVYGAFNAKGFNILSIAVSDKEPDWRRAMEEDKTPWSNGRDVEGVCNEIFDIPGIPGFVLVDKGGRIISYHCPESAITEFGPPLRGDTLFKTIERLFSPVGKQNYSITQVSPLKIGDKVPDIILGEMVSDPLLKPKVSDFKGKLLILDFWSTYCTVCIAQFPKIERLQKQFGEKVIILPVGFDAQKEGTIRSFLLKSKGTPRELKLPSVIQKPTDTLLMRLFPFSGLPHEIWISPEGTLIGLTDHRAITAQNIEAILSNNVLPFAINKPLNFTISSSKPFLINRDNPTPIYGSAFAGYIDTLSCISSGEFIKGDNVIRSYQANQTVLGYYKDAYSRIIPELTYSWGNKKVVIESHDQPFFKDWDETKGMDNWAYDNFARKNLFAYEVILPATYSVEEAYKYMISDLDRFFGVSSSIEKRNTKYLALVKIAPQGKIQAATGESVYSKKENDTLSLNGVDLTYLTGQLNSIMETSLEIRNETNYNNNINITLDLKDLNLRSITKQLKRYGLDLIEKEKIFKKLVLRNIRVK